MRNHPLSDLDADIRDHIERETQDNIERGMAPEEARYAALRKFGNVALAKETTRAIWVSTVLEQLVQDLRFGCRILTKSPALSAVAVLLKAIVVGGNTTVFSKAKSNRSAVIPTIRIWSHKAPRCGRCSCPNRGVALPSTMTMEAMQ